MDETAPRRARFGPFALDLETGELEREGVAVPLRPLATRLLLVLVRAEGRLVSHRELRRALWSEAAVEWRTGLHQAVRQLRRALDDRPGPGAWIQTVPRRGYRLDPRRLRLQPPCPLRPATLRVGLLGFGLGTVAGAVALPLALFVLLCVLLAGS